MQLKNKIKQTNPTFLGSSSVADSRHSKSLSLNYTVCIWASKFSNSKRNLNFLVFMFSRLSAVASSATAVSTNGIL